MASMTPLGTNGLDAFSDLRPGSVGASFIAIPRPESGGECWCGWFVASPLTNGLPHLHDNRHTAWMQAANAEDIQDYRRATAAPVPSRTHHLARTAVKEGLILQQTTTADKKIKLRDAIRTVLDEAGGNGLRVAQIWERAKQLGARTKSQDPERQVEDALHRLMTAEQPEARRVSRGVWTKA